MIPAWKRRYDSQTQTHTCAILKKKIHSRWVSRAITPRTVTPTTSVAPNCELNCLSEAAVWLFYEELIATQVTEKCVGLPGVSLSDMFSINFRLGGFMKASFHHRDRQDVYMHKLIQAEPHWSRFLTFKGFFLINHWFIWPHKHFKNVSI